MEHKLGLVGAGKNSAVLVISPLVALMVDQVQSLRSCGVNASIMTSSSGSIVTPELQATSTSFISDSLLFCAHEALFETNKWRERLEIPAVSTRIVAIMIDEAHCVSKW